MGTYIVNQPGSAVATFPNNLRVGDILRFNHTGSGADGTLLTWDILNNLKVQITAVGAGGKSAMNKVGGRPARMTGDFSLQKGATLSVLIGQVNDKFTSLGYSGGGGASGMWHKVSKELLIIAGGGGGCNGGNPTNNPDYWYNGNDASLTTTGNPGGTNGNGGLSTSSEYVMGGAGWEYDGGGKVNEDMLRLPQALKSGGLGGVTKTWANGGFGGGGGGLYAGGGGGYSGGNSGGSSSPAGGGGSYNAGTNRSNRIENVYSSNGFIEVTILQTGQINFGIPLYTKIGSVVKEYDSGWVNINGTLKELDKMWTKINGTLREV
ncbi:hypothetical protein 10S12_6 [uncultured Caudovirales phage]|uniref:Uncharacterized protein n=1 Tax=uncultured Caudovirales phage TaxID=2100421 RepID=A0A2H4JH33_9CAUD|nr:hypothetical protein 10S12_6 [uncultured Caudovirales phage]